MTDTPVDKGTAGDIDHLSAALVQQEAVLDLADALLTEALDEDGMDVGFEQRYREYVSKRDELSNWRTRDLVIVGEIATLRDALTAREKEHETVIAAWKREELEWDAERDALKARIAELSSNNACQHDNTKPAPTLRPGYPVYPPEVSEAAMKHYCNVCQCAFLLPITVAS